MATMAAINVQVNSEDKEKASAILKDLGISMSTFITMSLKQVIRVKGIPFELTTEEHFSKELIEAIKEADQIAEEIKMGKRKGYDNMEDFIKSLDD